MASKNEQVFCQHAAGGDSCVQRQGREEIQLSFVHVVHSNCWREVLICVFEAP